MTNMPHSNRMRNILVSILLMIICVIIGFLAGTKFNVSFDNILSNAVKEGAQSVNEKMIESPQSAKKFLKNMNPLD